MFGYQPGTLMGWFGNGDKDEDNSEAEESFSDHDIRKRIFKAEQDIADAEEGVENCRNEYKSHLQDGADASPGRRRVHAIRARIAKFKSNIYRLKRLKAIKSLSTWEIKQGMDQVDDMMADMQQSSRVNEIIGTDPDELQGRIDDAEADIAAEMQGMDDVMSALDIDSSSISVEATEEEELMDQLAKGNVDVDDLDFDTESIESSNANEDDDFDLGFSPSSSS